MNPLGLGEHAITFLATSVDDPVTPWRNSAVHSAMPWGWTRLLSAVLSTIDDNGGNVFKPKVPFVSGTALWLAWLYRIGYRQDAQGPSGACLMVRLKQPYLPKFTLQ